jgi:hypothetical protein
MVITKFFSGLIVDITGNWMIVVANFVLGGELLSWRISAVALTWLKYHASHHDHSLTCHVSAIQKDAYLSLCNLPGISVRFYSNDCDTRHWCVRGWASSYILDLCVSGLSDSHQWSLSCPVLICAITRTPTQTYFYYRRPGYWVLHGKSSHCV